MLHRLFLEYKNDKQGGSSFWYGVKGNDVMNEICFPIGLIADMMASTFVLALSDHYPHIITSAKPDYPLYFNSKQI